MLQGNRNTLHWPYTYQCLRFKEKMPDLEEAAPADYLYQNVMSQEFKGALYEVNGDLYGYDGNFLYEFIIPENNKHSPSKSSELPYEKPKRPSYEQLQKPNLYDILSPQPTDQALQPEVSKLQGNMVKGVMSWPEVSSLVFRF